MKHRNNRAFRSLVRVACLLSIGYCVGVYRSKHLDEDSPETREALGGHFPPSGHISSVRDAHRNDGAAIVAELHEDDPDNARKLEEYKRWQSAIESNERHEYAQHGEEGILEYIFDNIGGPRDKYFVEFGVESGKECNTRW